MLNSTSLLGLREASLRTLGWDGVTTNGKYIFSLCLKTVENNLFLLNNFS